MKRIALILSCLLVLILSFSTTSVAAQSVNAFDYAPYLFYESYNYYGEGNEFAGRNVELQYPPNEDGIYQVAIGNTGTTVVYIYQLTADGIYELAYFPETYNSNDLREHADVLDDATSLVMPASLILGESFSNGYSNERETRVQTFYADFQVLDTTYHNVVELVFNDVENEFVQHYYLAPNVGVIYEEYITYTDGEEAFHIVTGLEVLGPINHDVPVN